MIENFSPTKRNFFVIDKLQTTLHIMRFKTKNVMRQK